MNMLKLYSIVSVLLILLSIPMWVEAGTAWGSWTTIGSTGIDWRVKCGDYNEYARKRHWSYELRSRYHQTVDVYYTISDRRGNEDNMGMTLTPGDVDSSWGLFALNCGQDLWITLRKIEPR